MSKKEPELWGRLKKGRRNKGHHRNEVLPLEFFRVHFKPENRDGRVWECIEGLFYSNEISLWYVDKGYFIPYPGFVGLYDEQPDPILIKDALLHDPAELTKKRYRRRVLKKTDALSRSKNLSKPQILANSRRAEILALIEKEELNVNQLLEALQGKELFTDDGITDPNMRTVQRDLQILSKEFDIVCRTEESKNYWTLKITH